MNRYPTKSFNQHGVLRKLTGGVLLGAMLWWQASMLYAAERVVRIPSPAQDIADTGQDLQTAIFAGGCFWGVQGVFQHVKGVQRALSGYSGGTASQASYAAVSRGNTGHAESVEIIYDAKQVSYGQLLQIFFSVVHDPTQLNRQGPDVGTQYRSAIFATNPDQLKIAQAYIAQLDATGLFPHPIVTHVEAKPSFFPAEDYHQNYMVENPRNAYIFINDLPKVASLKQLFPESYRVKPVLIGSER